MRLEAAVHLDRNQLFARVDRDVELEVPRLQVIGDGAHGLLSWQLMCEIVVSRASLLDARPISKSLPNER